MVSMLMMVTKKPIEFVIVKAVPFVSGEAEWAIRVENWGESEVTEIPQTKSNMRKKTKEKWKIRGETKQQINEMVKATKAIWLFL